MAELVKRFAKNTKGNDYVVGDIHGHFMLLRKLLDEVGFDRETDRLFSVGDLVDRGPESTECLKWLDKPWFNAVRGNHEDMAIRYASAHDIMIGNYVRNGGAWFVYMHEDERQAYRVMFEDAPVAIEVETDYGLVGIIHADLPDYDWQNSMAMLQENRRQRHAMEHILWGRTRITTGDATPVNGVDFVFCGHTPCDTITTLGNVIYLDTGACFEGSLSIMCLDDHSSYSVPAI